MELNFNWVKVNSSANLAYRGFMKKKERYVAFQLTTTTQVS